MLHATRTIDGVAARFRHTNFNDNNQRFTSSIGKDYGSVIRDSNQTASTKLHSNIIHSRRYNKNQNQNQINNKTVANQFKFHSSSSSSSLLSISHLSRSLRNSRFSYSVLRSPLLKSPLFLILLTYFLISHFFSSSILKSMIITANAEESESTNSEFKNHHQLKGSDELQKMIKSNPDGVFVKFTVPWSMKCRQFDPIFKSASNNLNNYLSISDSDASDATMNKNNNNLNNSTVSLSKLKSANISSIPFVTIDMTDSKNDMFSKKYMIRGFPTLIFFHMEEDGQEHRYEYNGNPEEQGLIEFITHMITPVLQSDFNATEDEKLAISLYDYTKESDSNNNINLKTIFTKLAKSNRQKAYWHYSASSTSTDSLNTVTPSRLEIKHKGEPKRELILTQDKLSDSKIAESAINKFFHDSLLPYYGVVSRESFGEYAGKPLLWVLPDHGSNDFLKRYEELRPFFINVYEKVKSGGGIMQYHMAATNTHDFRQPLMQMFNIATFPSIVAQKRSGDREYWTYPDNNDLSYLSAEGSDSKNSDLIAGRMKELDNVNSETSILAQKVADWLIQIGNGKLDRTLKSEPIPDYEVEAGEPKMIVAKNFEEKVFDKNRDVLLNVYAPWCGHCKNFNPQFRKVARKIHLLGMEEKITVGMMDGTANEASSPEVVWDGFPSIFFIKAGTRQAMQYNSGNRDASEVYKWVLKHSTFQGQMDQELGEVKMDL